MGGDRACRPRARRIQKIRQPGGSQAQRRRRDRDGGKAARQYSGHLPKMLCPSRNIKRLHVGRPCEDDRRENCPEIQAAIFKAQRRRNHGAGIPSQAAGSAKERRLMLCPFKLEYQSAYGVFFTAFLLRSAAPSFHHTGPRSPKARFALSTA